jgi:LmbE family N-acetylglucosaminyl deacetylase
LHPIIGKSLVVLSPHLDDAVFSVGAFMHRWSRADADVRLVTVLANDPDARGPAGSWDASCGFWSAAEAARARREEDRRACAIVGARPVWLPYADETYTRSASDDEIWRTILESLEGCDLVLVPGFPLRHADHAWLNALVVERQAELTCAVGFYGEQPYASAAVAPPPPSAFDRAATAPRDVYAKLRACLQYRSQLRALGARVLLHAFVQELRRGGELVALPPPRQDRR